MLLHFSLKSQFCKNYECYKETETVDKEDWEEVDGSVIDFGLLFGVRFPIVR